MVRWTAISVAGLLGALVLALVVVVALGTTIDLDWAKGRIEMAASQAMDRQVFIEGPVSLDLAVPPAAQVEGVRVGNPAGWREGDLVRLQRARVVLRILPLLKGELLIEEVSVDGLQLDLETNADGQPNWLFGDAGERAEPAPPEQRESSVLRFIELVQLSLSAIAITHRDAATDKTFELKLDEITGSVADSEPMRLAVKGDVQAVPYELTVTAGNLAALYAGQAPWPLEVSATAADIRLGIGGTVAQPLRAKGLDLDFNLTGPNMQALEQILGTDLPPFRSFAMKGRIEEVEGRYRLADLEGALAAAKFTGMLEADTAGDKLRLLGEIDVRRLDAQPLFAAISAQPGAGMPTESPQRQASGKNLQEVDAEAEEGIDIDEPVLTLKILDGFDARLGLTIHEVVNVATSLEEVRLEVNIVDGVLSAPLNATLARVAFKGELGLAQTEGEPNIAVSLSSEQSEIGELAALLSGAQGIEGRFEWVRLELSARGETLRALVESAELRAAIEDASLSYGHDSGGRPVEFTLDEAELWFPAVQASQLSARGSLLGEAFAVQLSGGTFVEHFVQKRSPVELKASGAGAELLIGGTFQRVAAGKGTGKGTELDFELTGERIGSFAAWLGVSPGAAQAYALKGGFVRTGKDISLQIERARIGASAFAGVAGIREESDMPVTFADLDFEVLDVKGLMSVLPERSQPVGSEVFAQGPEALKIDVPILPNGIELFDSDLNIVLARLRLEPIDFTQVSVSANIRDGYVDSAPLRASAAGAQFQGSFGIDLRGAVPKVDLHVKSSRVDVGKLLAELGLVEGLALTAGGFDLGLAVEGASTREMLERSRLSVALKDGALTLSAPGAQQGVDIRVPTATVSAEPQKPITLALDGRIDQTPVQMRVTTDTLGSFAEPKKRLKMNLGVAMLEAELRLTGAAPLPVRAEDLHFAMDFTGTHFSDFNELLNVDLPPIGPYRLGGEFGSRPSGFYVQNLELTVGESTLKGTLDLETTRQPPRLDVELVATHIQLDDFETGDWSATGEQTGPSDVAPAPDAAGVAQAERRSVLSPEVMRSLDAQLEVTIDEVLSGQDHLGRGTLSATLGDGRLSVDPLTLDVPGGLVDLDFAFTPGAGSVTFEAGARIDRLDYGILARRIDPQSQTAGEISVDLDLKTRGPNLRGVMQGANGHLAFGIWPRDLNAGVFDLWAVNVITALAKEVDKDKASSVNCVIASFQIDDGLMQDRVVFADTSRMQVEGTAQVDFKQRTLRVRAAPKAKRPEFFSVAVPIGLSGQLEDFGVNINPLELTGQAVSFVTSPLHVPLRRIFKKRKPEDGYQACAEAWDMRLVQP